ncbi:hypothetical protein BDF19DRAFT_283933 [Syncephalis fuscata]|nr:hypothetical protein BDF19DRAFT_283933 [Syncephalis fuscata]
MQRRSQTTVQNTNTTPSSVKNINEAVPMSSIAATAPALPRTPTTAINTAAPAIPPNSNIPTIPEDVVDQFPQVNQGTLAWFATPPVDVVSPAQPFHSVAYLAYKQRQRSLKKGSASSTPNTGDLNTNVSANTTTKSLTASSDENTKLLVDALQELTKQQLVDASKIHKALGTLE